MAMKRCPVCGERYSDTYKECPFCEEEEYWEDEQQEPARRPILREGVRSPGGHGGHGGRSAYSIVTPILLVLIVLMALLLVYLLYGDKLFGKDKDPEDNKPGITEPQQPDGSTPAPGNTPAVDPGETDGPDASGDPGAEEPGTDAPELPGTSTAPEGSGTTPGGTTPGGTTPGGTTPGGSSGGMSYASAAALPGGLTLNSTDFTRNVSEGAYKLRVSGGTGTYTWISENPSIATVGSDGTITPVAAGITNVVVTDGSKRAICIVRVTGGSAPSGGGTTSGGTTSGGSLKAGKAVVVNGGNGVRVRSGPGTSYDILATVPNGGSVQVVRATGTDDWYEITFTAVGGVTTTGYMKGEFLANG